MSVKTIERYSGPGVVSERLISRVVQVDRPLDGGGDYEIEGPGQAAVERSAIAFRGWRQAGEAAANVAVVDRAVESAIAEVALSQGVSYAGEVPALPEEPEPGFKPFPTLP